MIALILGGGYLIYQGANYWVDISGPAPDKIQNFVLQSVGELSVIYPGVIRPRSTYTLEVELQPFVPITRTSVLTLTISEDSDFVWLSASTITIPINTSALHHESFQLMTRNPSLPPRSVSLTINGHLGGSTESQVAKLDMRVDQLTVRVRAIASIIMGAIGSMAAVVGLAKAFR